MGRGGETRFTIPPLAYNRAVESSQVYAQMRDHCMSLHEQVVEEYPWQDVAWKIGGKAFVFGSPGGNRFTIKATKDQQQALVQLPGVEVAAYVGRFGWITIEVDTGEQLDLAKNLAEEAFRQVRPKRLL